MNNQYTLNPDGSFTIKDYNQAHPFSNFLPGIAGEWGIPLWVFYVNRGQGVVSFGIQDKDHAICEFFPANKAYAFAPLFGFRTFIKINGRRFYEPFSMNSAGREQMTIKSASFSIQEINSRLGLSVSVRYFTLPNTSVAGLVRIVTIANIGKRNIDCEVLDGLPRITPFGASHSFLKDISRTLEAWMCSSSERNLAMFRLVVDPRDVSHTRRIEGANFHYAFFSDNGRKQLPRMIVDPQVVFSQDTSLLRPLGFLESDFRKPIEQVSVGKTPCSFSYAHCRIPAGSRRTLYSVFGASFKHSLIKKNVQIFTSQFIKDKEAENESVVEGIKRRALCVSGSSAFDHYLQCTYLDNVLRGGFAYCPNHDCGSSNRSRNKNAYYIFSRKHGDLERDYNYFNLLPSYFSEGQSSYRDVNQNRRMDLFFNPSLGIQNILYFMNLLKIDGYNPLVIKGEKLYFERQRARSLLKEFDIKDQRLLSLMARGFYLGEFFKLMEEEGIPLKFEKREALVVALLTRARREAQAHHGEGYWIDHWRYNLDLIEAFLYFYPDKESDLFLNNNFLFWDDEYKVRPRAGRYVLRLGRVYQGESVEVVREKRALLKERKAFKNFLRTKNGSLYKTNLVVKMVSLVANKLASLDPYGIGIEMEADKPGWCDSLNGLPALFGSSLCETFELKRAILILQSALKKVSPKGPTEFKFPYELADFVQGLQKILRFHAASQSKTKDFAFWDKANRLKEEFRDKTFFCLAGRERKISLRKLDSFLQEAMAKVQRAIHKARDKESGLYPSYFIYTPKKYLKKNSHIVISGFTKRAVALSLEGPMHALRVEDRPSLVSNVRRSELFDKKLNMYRLNASLKNEPLEIGRSRVFVPGWLENESIWLHMEYKYLLELLKRGYYKQFYTDLYNCAVCFFDPAVYGRNILENSSFIVSSAYPDKSLWGKGFVARLSGATAEFLNIWVLLCLGQRPFFMAKGGLCLRFAPLLKKEFFTKGPKTITCGGRKIVLPANTFSFSLFSRTLVCYHNPRRKDTFSRTCSVDKIVISLQGDRKIICYNDIIRPPHSLAVRRAEAERIDVYFR